MTIYIRREGRGWDTYPAVKFRWSAANAEWADEVGPMFRDTLKQHCPVNDRPHFANRGRLRESITFNRDTAAGESIILDFTAHTSYAAAVVKGAVPHDIFPVAARALHWYDRPEPGHEYFSSGVHHPGQKPNRFPVRALEQDGETIERRFIDTVAAHLTRALKE